ncbi:MAG: putative membrane protein YphA (DoxX/SURF4 family) [Paraglaciecola sp.]|jgi:uncharacterized membrane protein YphA (DoxX/SURF4 family)
MKFFDGVNFIGRLLVAMYFMYEGILFFFQPNDQVSTLILYFFYFLAFWKIAGGLALAGGIKPRATAAVLAIILIINVVLSFFFIEGNNTGTDFLMQRISLLGTLLFIAGTRMIPYGLMIRSEDSMNEKYGG